MFEEKTTPQINLTSSFSVLQIKKNSFVFVRYDGDYFPGIVEEVGENEYKVNVLHTCRGGWCWPNLKDSVWYSQEDIMKQIKDPLPVDSRGIFMFHDNLCE
ncbi:hypothetical protein Btru_028451 [Bulinus truncatus]|nr:hypothetical protein Btru_028451 [Bulinus truncatus]